MVNCTNVGPMFDKDDDGPQVTGMDGMMEGGLTGTPYTQYTDRRVDRIMDGRASPPPMHVSRDALLCLPVHGGPSRSHERLFVGGGLRGLAC